MFFEGPCFSEMLCEVCRSVMTQCLGFIFIDMRRKGKREDWWDAAKYCWLLNLGVSFIVTCYECLKFFIYIFFCFLHRLCYSIDSWVGTVSGWWAWQWLSQSEEVREWASFLIFCSTVYISYSKHELRLVFCLFIFWPYLQQVQVPRPGLKRAPQKWQHCICNH